MLNTSADSLGINQRAHYSIDQFATSTKVPYSTIRPAIFSASLLAAAPEVRLAHLDRPGRQRPDGPDRPSRRGRGRAARAHRPGTAVTSAVDLIWPRLKLPTSACEAVTLRIG